MLWPLLHDPASHWSTFSTDPAVYHAYVWEDQWPEKRTRRSAKRAAEHVKGAGGGGGRPLVHHHHHHDLRPHHVVNLDAEAYDARRVPEPDRPDYDVS